MKFSTVAAATTLGAVASATGGPVQFDLRSHNMPSKHLASYIMKPVSNLLDTVGGNHKRDAVKNGLELTPSYNFYVTNISVGTPPQNLEVGFDTGSPYLWVFGPNGSYNHAKQFYPDKSSSFYYQNKTFSASYGAGMLNGKWGEDKIHVGDDTLPSFPFGVVEQFSVSAGVPGLIGIGPGPNLTNESYSNVPEAFYEEGVTNSPIFSVFLDQKSDHGGVIFGGYDPTKYKEPIYKFDIVNNAGSHGSPQSQGYYYQTRMDTVALNGENYTVKNNVVLDTGSPFCQLPPGFVKKIGEKYGLKSNEKYQAYYKQANSTVKDDDVVSFNLGHFKADIPLKNLFVPGKFLWVDDGPQDVEALAIMGAPQYVLGDVFFKHVYSAFDSKNSHVYLAEATNDFTKDNVKELNGGEIPGAVQGRESSQAEAPASFKTIPPAYASSTAGAANYNGGSASPNSPPQNPNKGDTPDGPGQQPENHKAQQSSAGQAAKVTSQPAPQQNQQKPAGNSGAAGGSHDEVPFEGLFTALGLDL